MKKGLIKSLCVGIGFVIIDLIMFIAFATTDFSNYNTIYLGLAIFAEIAIIGAIIIYDINKIDGKK